jgi:hypothetical protein
MIGYKIVRVKGDSLVSAYVGSNVDTIYSVEKKLETEYKIGEWVKAKYIALYAFKTFKAAKDWLEINKRCITGETKLFQCEYQKSKSKFVFTFCLSGDTIKTWLEDLKVTFSFAPGKASNFAIGSVACSKIKLLKEITS